MAELILSLKGRELSRHALGSQVRIGRDPASEILIDNMGVSRHHATIFQSGDTFVVRDEGSQNGVYVNGQRATECTLRDGDVVQLGKFSLQLNVAGRGSMPPPGLEQRSLPPREMAQTMALAPNEVQKLISAQPAQKTAIESEPQDNSLKVLIFGLLIIVALATVAWFILIE